MPLAPIEGIPDPSGADCLTCGRCCHHGPSTVSLLEEDEARLEAATLQRLTVLQDRPPHMRFLRNDGEKCAALGTPEAGPFACAIYLVRPTGCREVEVGSPCCLEARRLGHLGSSVEFVRARA
jgi:Fe-S-cluster containining protein